MPLEMVPLENAHIEDVAHLACLRYRALCQQVPLLPSRYGEVDTLLPKLGEILSDGPAVAALQGSRLVGFVAAWVLPSFRGRKAAYSPEWANGALLEQSAEIYEAMYAHVSALWLAQGSATHLVSLLANDALAVSQWPWMGFGMITTDAVRDLSLPSGIQAENAEIRQAGIADLAAFMELEHALARYLAEAPTFLLDAAPGSTAETLALLDDAKKAVWLAVKDGEPIAYLLIGPASENASTIIYDEGTCSITGAYTKPEVRGRGIALALLNRALLWAQDQGYSRCAVDFEPMNALARRFWLGSFTPVCYGFARIIS